MSVRATIGDSVVAERRSHFVGRAPELRFAEQLLDGTSPKKWFHVYAPGGFGKSTLLEHIADRAERECTVYRYSLSAVEVDRGAVLDLFADISRKMDSDSSSALIALDDFDAHQSLLEVYRTEAIPSLPQSARLLTTGRHPLPPRLLVDIGWGRLIEERELGLLNRTESFALLRNLDLPPEDHARLVRRTRGHPLSLACSGLRSSALESLDEAGHHASHSLELPDLSPTLIADQAPAFSLLGLCWELPVELLVATLGPEKADHATQLLSSLPFVRKTQTAFRVHSLYREAILSCLSEVAPAAIARAGLEAIRWYADCLDSTPRYRERLPIARAWPYLVQHDPVARSSLSGLGSEGLYWDECSVEDLSDATDWNRFIQGAPLPGHPTALSSDPHWTQVLRDREGAAVGLACWAIESSERKQQLDPFLQHLNQQGVWKGTQVLRTWGALRDSPVSESVVKEIVARSAIEAVARPKLRRYLIAVSDSQDTESWLENGFLQRFSDLDVVINGEPIRVYGLDFTNRSSTAWMVDLGEQLFQRQPEAVALSATKVPPAALRNVALSIPINEAVREALRMFRDDVRLGATALPSALRKNLAPEVALSTTRDLIKEAIGSLPQGPEPASPQKLILASFIEGDEKQVTVAGELGLSYSTYRRKLSRAVLLLVDLIERRIREAN